MHLVFLYNIRGGWQIRLDELCHDECILHIISPTFSCYSNQIIYFQMDVMHVEHGCRDLGEALRRIAEGASMLRTKGEAGTGNIVGDSQPVE
jgi:pyridoxal biosynthesis lyase PdxS